MSKSFLHSLPADIREFSIPSSSDLEKLNISKDQSINSSNLSSTSTSTSSRRRARSSTVGRRNNTDLNRNDVFDPISYTKRFYQNNSQELAEKHFNYLETQKNRIEYELKAEVVEKYPIFLKASKEIQAMESDIVMIKRELDQLDMTIGMIASYGKRLDFNEHDLDVSENEYHIINNSQSSLLGYNNEYSTSYTNKISNNDNNTNNDNNIIGTTRYPQWLIESPVKIDQFIHERDFISAVNTIIKVRNFAEHINIENLLDNKNMMRNEYNYEDHKRNKIGIIIENVENYANILSDKLSKELENPRASALWGAHDSYLALSLMISLGSIEQAASSYTKGQSHMIRLILTIDDHNNLNENKIKRMDDPIPFLLSLPSSFFSRLSESVETFLELFKNLPNPSNPIKHLIFWISQEIDAFSTFLGEQIMKSNFLSPKSIFTNMLTLTNDNNNNNNNKNNNNNNNKENTNQNNQTHTLNNQNILHSLPNILEILIHFSPESFSSSSFASLYTILENIFSTALKYSQPGLSLIPHLILSIIPTIKSYLHSMTISLIKQGKFEIAQDTWISQMNNSIPLLCKRESFNGNDLRLDSGRSINSPKGSNHQRNTETTLSNIALSLLPPTRRASMSLRNLEVQKIEQKFLTEMNKVDLNDIQEDDEENDNDNDDEDNNNNNNKNNNDDLNYIENIMNNNNNGNRTSSLNINDKNSVSSIYWLVKEAVGLCINGKNIVNPPTKILRDLEFTDIGPFLSSCIIYLIASFLNELDKSIDSKDHGLSTDQIFDLTMSLKIFEKSFLSWLTKYVSKYFLKKNLSKSKGRKSKHRRGASSTSNLTSSSTLSSRPNYGPDEFRYSILLIEDQIKKILEKLNSDEI